MTKSRLLVKDGYYAPRCHLVLGFDSYSRRNTIIFPATDVCLHVAEYSAVAFDCALSGPFNELRSAGSQHSGSLYVHVIVFTSASMVFMDDMCLLSCILHCIDCVVNNGYMSFYRIIVLLYKIYYKIIFYSFLKYYFYYPRKGKI